MELLKKYEQSKGMNIIKDLKEFHLLGSEIGIHGGGAFKREKGKENYHWTQGCISLDNKDLENLLKIINLHTKVYIVDDQKSLFEILKKLSYPKVVKPFDFWEGSLYLKIDNDTYWYFRLIEKLNGYKYLEWKEWVKGALNREKISPIAGRFEDALEKYLKELLLKNLNNIIDPLERRDFEEWK